jgi:hypothetical protein
MFVTDVGRKVGRCAIVDFDCLTRKHLTGHWIQDCPTNSDREFDNKPRIKRTTGIPRSFLKAVENPNKGEITQGVMVTPDGGYVVAQPDLWVFVRSAIRCILTRRQGFLAEAIIPSEGVDCC